VVVVVVEVVVGVGAEVVSSAADVEIVDGLVWTAFGGDTAEDGTSLDTGVAGVAEQPETISSTATLSR
jgi:hypothetical protein